MSDNIPSNFLTFRNLTSHEVIFLSVRHESASQVCRLNEDAGFTCTTYGVYNLFLFDLQIVMVKNINRTSLMDQFATADDKQTGRNSNCCKDIILIFDISADLHRQVLDATFRKI